MKRFLAAALVGLSAFGARADAVDALQQFVREVKTGSAAFTQTVTSPDGVKKKTSSGSFEFSRPNRFRFAYQKPFEQLIVADGSKVWIYDADLNQASSRKFTHALGATPAALLAGGNLEQDFDLSPLPDRDGLAWVQAQPKIRDSGINLVKVGFRERRIAAVEITDSFGQQSLLQFSDFKPNVPIDVQRFRFVPPKGADVIEQ